MTVGLVYCEFKLPPGGILLGFFWANRDTFRGESSCYFVFSFSGNSTQMFALLLLNDYQTPILYCPHLPKTGGYILGGVPYWMGGTKKYFVKRPKNIWCFTAIKILSWGGGTIGRHGIWQANKSTTWPPWGGTNSIFEDSQLKFLPHAWHEVGKGQKNKMKHLFWSCVSRDFTTPPPIAHNVVLLSQKRVF